jgi:hypothetical protein
MYHRIGKWCVLWFGVLIDGLMVDDLGRRDGRRVRDCGVFAHGHEFKFANPAYVRNTIAGPVLAVIPCRGIFLCLDSRICYRLPGRYLV